MVLSVRLGEKVDDYLESLVRKGTYPTKAEAIRAAINSFAQIQTYKAQGYRVLALPPGVAEKLALAYEVA